MYSYKKLVPFAALAAVASLSLLLSGCTSGKDDVAKLTGRAEKGDVEAMVKIAEIYCGAKNIDQDDQVCGMWLKRASEKGHKRSQYMLGRMYEMGLGMRADPVQAYKWYSLSAAQEYHMSAAGAKRVWETMNEQQRENAQRAFKEGQLMQEVLKK